MNEWSLWGKGGELINSLPLKRGGCYIWETGLNRGFKVCIYTSFPWRNMNSMPSVVIFFFRLYLVFSDWRCFRIPALGSFREGGRCLSSYRWVIKHWSNKRYLSTLGWLSKPDTKVLDSMPWVIIVLNKLTQRFQPCQPKRRERYSRAHERRRR